MCRASRWATRSPSSARTGPTPSGPRTWRSGRKRSRGRCSHRSARGSSGATRNNGAPGCDFRWHKAGVRKLAVLMAESPARTAFAEEALTHLDTLYRGALRLTRDPDQAQDLVQEAYLRALRYQHSYQPGTNMKAWLFAIMRNLFWDRFKGSRKEDVSLDDVGEFVLYDKLRDEGAKPESDVLDKLAASEVVSAVEKLPPLHREVVLLVDVEGFSYKDAAQTLELPIGTVMSRLHRARQQLQKSLYDYAVESGIVRANGTKEVPQQ